MKTDWKDFVENQAIPIKFLHKDEFAEQYPEEKAKFPCGFLKKEKKLSVFISAGEINECKSIEDLKDLVNRKIKVL